MTQPRATWVLWFKWDDTGWARECLFTPGDNYESGKCHARYYLKYVCGQWSWLTPSRYRILPEGKEPK